MRLTSATVKLGSIPLLFTNNNNNGMIPILFVDMGVMGMALPLP